MSDWWAKKLGTQPLGTAPSRAYPPTQAPSSDGFISTPAAAPQQPMPPVTTENLGQLLQFWKGGQGARNTGRCPECGSESLFRRMVGSMEAAPLCYSCGYNGRFQQGDPTNWSA
jgi:hypothetical protein